MSKARDLANAGTALTTVSATELGYLDGVTSAVQTQIDSKIGQSTAINPTIVDAKGDIIAASAADTVARLAVGANDTVLTADSSTVTGLKWATPAAGGMTLLSTTSMTSGSTFTVSSISQSYTNLYIEWYGMTWTDLDRNIYVYCNGVTNTMNYSGTKGSSADAGVNGYLYISGSDQISYNTADNSYSMTIEDYTNTSRYKTFRSTGTGYSNAIGNFKSTHHGGTIRTLSAITSISITPQDQSYTFTAGTCKVWGIK